MQKEVNFEANLELQRAIAYLDEVVSSLKDGKVVVERTHNFVALEPTHFVQMELAAAAGDKHERLTLKLSWDKPIDYDLKISSVEPAEQPEEEEKEKDVEADEEREECRQFS